MHACVRACVRACVCVCVCVCCKPVRRGLPLGMVTVICVPLAMTSVVSVLLVLGVVLLSLPPVTPLHRARGEGLPAHALLWPVPPVASALHSSCCLHNPAGTFMFRHDGSMAAVQDLRFRTEDLGLKM